MFRRTHAFLQAKFRGYEDQRFHRLATSQIVRQNLVGQIVGSTYRSMVSVTSSKRDKSAGTINSNTGT